MIFCFAYFGWKTRIAHFEWKQKKYNQNASHIVKYNLLNFQIINWTGQLAKPL